MAELHEESYKQGFVDGVKSKVTEELTDVIEALVKGMHEAIVKSSEYIIESVSVEKIDVQPNRWISCKDKMPEHGVTVLIYTGNHTISLAWYDKEMEYFYICDSDYKYNPLDVTHWRPLPEPPKKEG